MMRAFRWTMLVVVSVAGVGTWNATAVAVPFTTGYTDGGTWDAVYAQGFKASVTPSPDPGHAIADTVFLDKFQFFKSGATTHGTDGMGNPIPLPPAQNFQLAIVNTFFMNLATLTTSSSQLVGLSTNTIGDAAAIATGSPITFNFNHVPITYGANNQDEEFNNNYAAIFVHNDGVNLTPLLVPAIIVNYLPGQNEIQSDYGLSGDYLLSASNFTHTNSFGTFFDAFNQTDSGGHGDANFTAFFDQPAAAAGDYNGDTVVNAADYTIWRDTLGSTTDLRANGDNTGLSAGKIDNADYTIWKTNFGIQNGSGGLAPTGGSVPEPCTLVLSALAGLMCAWLCRRHKI